MTKTKRAALYVRVSSDRQTVENQLAELRRAPEFERWTEVAVYKDEGISGAKGRDKRPGLDQLLEDAKRRKFDVIVVWALDRLGRSLRGLLDTVEFIHNCRVDLYLMRERIDTTSDTGKLLFSILGSLAEFERATIQRRAAAGSFSHAFRDQCANLSSPRFTLTWSRWRSAPARPRVRPPAGRA